jgi:hypothetical protein
LFHATGHGTTIVNFVRTGFGATVEDTAVVR